MMHQCLSVITILICVTITNVYSQCLQQFGSDNTLCKYTGVNPKTCINLSKQGLTEAEKQEVLRKHNELRAKVANGHETRGENSIGQPSASNMEEMVYDEDIAKVAQMWADQCTFSHDSNRRTAKFSYVGQNVFIGWQSNKDNTPSWSSAVQSWYDEVDKFNSNDVESYAFEYATGHYTQVMWATSNRLGCGYVAYEDPSKPWWRYTKLYVCNYGPGGNIIGQDIYKTGYPASQCSSRIHSTTYPGLCR